MKTTIIISICLIAIIYLGEPTINFKPFSISFEKPYLPFAIIFLGISIAFYSIQYDKIGYKRGLKDMSEAITEILKETKNK